VERSIVLAVVNLPHKNGQEGVGATAEWIEARGSKTICQCCPASLWSRARSRSRPLANETGGFRQLLRV